MRLHTKIFLWSKAAVKGDFCLMNKTLDVDVEVDEKHERRRVASLSVS